MIIRGIILFVFVSVSTLLFGMLFMKLAFINDAGPFVTSNCLAVHGDDLSAMWKHKCLKVDDLNSEYGFLYLPAALISGILFLILNAIFAQIRRRIVN